VSARGRPGILTRVADGLEHTGYTAVLLVAGLAKGCVPLRPLRTLGRLVEQLHVQLVKSILVVSVVGAFMGMILALQTGEELRRYGAEGQLASIVAGSMAREMGPFITAIILAATVGAATAAELGTMRVSEEIDALELMNIDPVRFLVTPRIQALGLSAVLLTVLVNVIGIAGGAVVANAQFGIRYLDFFEGARNALAAPWLLGVLSKDLYSGLTKSLVFGLMIGALACAAGLKASGGALGVGRAVRGSVVASVVATLVVGYVITWMFWVAMA
jgi:phospholipid/cholesterol/gamma-HCH transport system permease protein